MDELARDIGLAVVSPNNQPVSALPVRQVARLE